MSAPMPSLRPAVGETGTVARRCLRATRRTRSCDWWGMRGTVAAALCNVAEMQDLRGRKTFAVLASFGVRGTLKLWKMHKNPPKKCTFAERKTQCF